jgi:DNA-binding PucR family transcriptional regulator
VSITEAGGSSDQGVNLLGKLGSRDRPHPPVALASPDVPALPPAVLRRVDRASSGLARAAVARMHAELPWFPALPPDQRSWIGLVVQSGVASFVAWLQRREAASELPAGVFAEAPRELAGVITLEQTVALVRVAVSVVEAAVLELAPDQTAALTDAVLRYSREIAFSAAQVYARAAEERGAWDARLEALVVDAVLRGETGPALMSQAAALSWRSPQAVSLLIGLAPPGPPEVVLSGVQRTVRHAGLTALAGVQGERLVVVLGVEGDAVSCATALIPAFGEGPLVVGPTVSDLAQAGTSARAALAAQRVVPAWPDAPRPVHADDLLPERALDGDPLARSQLAEQIYPRILAAGPAAVETVTAYLATAGGLQATARQLYVHVNTVRYRLRRVAEACDLTPDLPRDAFVLRVALTLGRLARRDRG